MIRVRFAVADDRAALEEFIHDHWSASHIFVHHPEVFEWQHLQDDGRFNMVVAEEVAEDRSAVLGILGFIPFGHFGSGLGDRDIMLAIWKVKDEGAPPGLGLRLLKYLDRELSPDLIGAIGISDIVRPLYRLLKYELGSLTQAVIFHPELTPESSRVASGVPTESCGPAPTPDRSVRLVRFDEIDEPTINRLGAASIPTKNVNYVRRRFVEHPWYRYEIRGVEVDGAIEALCIWRVVSAAGTQVLRIVDIVGEVDWLASAGVALQAEVVAADAEYLDLMVWGIPDEVLATGGFTISDGDSDLIVPNYFAPFERRHIRVDLAVISRGDRGVPLRLYRADSDQDRPNSDADLSR